MICVSFLYPNTEGSKFDVDYYLNNHCPLSQRSFGTALKGFSVETGIGGIVPGTAPPFHAIGRLTFDSVEAFYEALMPHMDELKADVIKYTDVEAIIQIGEIKLPFV